MVRVGVKSGWMLLDARESSRENDADEGEKGGQSCQLRERVECPGQGADERDQRSDGCEAYSADCMRAHGVQIARYYTEDNRSAEPSRSLWKMAWVTHSTCRP